jgi:hypothetical protein
MSFFHPIKKFSAMIKLMSISCWIFLLCLLPPNVKAQFYRNTEELYKAPVSRCYGFNEGYLPKNQITRYRIEKPANDNRDDLTQAWFDISNNNIICSVNANGLVEYPSVMGPLSGYEVGKDNDNSAGYLQGDYITGSQWTITVNDGSQSILLSKINNPSLDIIDNIFYKWNYQFNHLKIQSILFAPEAEENPLVPEPRALIMMVNLENTGKSKMNGKISLPDKIFDAFKIDTNLQKALLYGPAVLPVADSHKGSRANYHPKFAEVAPTVAGYEAVMLLDSTQWDPSYPDISFSLEPGKSINLKFAFLVGGSVKELIHTRNFVRSKSTLNWLNSTAKLHKKATGNLIIPQDPMLAELFDRYYECSHSCYILKGNGTLTEPKGGSWSMMSLLNPGYILGSLQNIGRVAEMVPFHDKSIKTDVSFSLYGSTQELIIAADYYQRGGDPAFFKNEAFRKNASDLISKILTTQYLEATLFPSKNIWDGPSRGDYHTGSNILVWRVLDIFSRIAKDVWKDTSTADLWSKKALSCKSDILTKCTISGPYGRQFAEGTWKNGTVDNATKCHDGEEVALVQSAFYGLVEQDNPLVTNHCRASMTPFNYLYNSTLNAMMWQDVSYYNYGYTFPAWLVLIAGATTNREMLSGIIVWKSMTDLDGSPWWWPYDSDQTDPSVVNRRKANFKGGFCDVAKVPYATSVFNTLLINNVIGLSADVPNKTFSFRPFSPWSSFEWKDGRIGNAFFDLKYSDDGSKITAKITNRNKESYSGIIGLTVPENKVLSGQKPTGKRYSRNYYQMEKTLKPGQTEVVTIQYKADRN